MLARPLMTLMALWLPAFPPAPTSIVRKNVTARCRFKRPCEPQLAPTYPRQGLGTWQQSHFRRLSCCTRAREAADRQ